MVSNQLFHKFLVAGSALVFSLAAHSANVLFVSDSQSDTNIPGILMADGHTVTAVLDDFTVGPNTNAVLTGSLAAYDVIVWSATGDGWGGVHDAATATNLTNWVTGGGRLFVTGYDTIISPDDPVLQALLGGSGANDVGDSSGPVLNVANSLTTGLVDIRGITPTGGYSSDMDSLSGLGLDTVCVVADTSNPGSCHWTLRTLGNGEIAYVSNGEVGISAHASWADTSVGGAGAYNAALRNFAFAADAVPPAPPTPVPTLSEWGMILLSSLLALGTLITLRRQRQ
jgi:hypothetical protein